MAFSAGLIDSSNPGLCLVAWGLLLFPEVTLAIAMQATSPKQKTRLGEMTHVGGLLWPKCLIGTYWFPTIPLAVQIFLVFRAWLSEFDQAILIHSKPLKVFFSPFAGDLKTDSMGSGCPWVPSTLCSGPSISGRTPCAAAGLEAVLPGYGSMS